tara:strand:+ start:539 stop:709 length:171 start_codon:yes stop_codon:yes gene_type:complete
MKRYDRHERAVERKLDEIIKLLTTQPRDRKHDDERIEFLKKQYMKKNNKKKGDDRL